MQSHRPGGRPHLLAKSKMFAMVNQRTVIVQAVVSTRITSHHQDETLINHKFKCHGVRKRVREQSCIESTCRRGQSHPRVRDRWAVRSFKNRPKNVQRIEEGQSRKIHASVMQVSSNRRGLSNVRIITAEAHQLRHLVGLDRLAAVAGQSRHTTWPSSSDSRHTRHKGQQLGHLC